MTNIRIGLFTRLLETATPAERYRFALEQIQTAEKLGFHSAWVAQHHFHEAEGGLPSPFVLLGAAAVTTSRIRLGTGVITLPHEDPVRVAEDAAVVDELSNHRVELGLGSGGTPTTFRAFGLDPADRREAFNANFERLLDAFGGEELGDPDNRLYPEAEDLQQRIWQATFSADGARRAGERGDGLMLSRSQPRPPEDPDASLSDIQEPIVAAYDAALPIGVQRRVLASRTVVVLDAEDRDRVLEAAEPNLRSFAAGFLKRDVAELDLDDVLRVTDSVVGTVDEVVDRLRLDRVADNATDVAFQVHSIEPGHDITLRSLELLATRVAPALGWGERRRVRAVS